MKYRVEAGIMSHISSLAVLSYWCRDLSPKAWRRCLRNIKKNANFCDMLEIFFPNSPKLYFQLKKKSEMDVISTWLTTFSRFHFKVLSSTPSKHFALTATYSRDSQIYHLLKEEPSFYFILFHLIFKFGSYCLHLLSPCTYIRRVSEEFIPIYSLYLSHEIRMHYKTNSLVFFVLNRELSLFSHSWK